MKAMRCGSCRHGDRWAAKGMRAKGAAARCRTRAWRLAAACLAACAVALCAPPGARADEGISGTCYVACTNAHISGAAGGNVFAVTFPQYGIETTGYCISGATYGTPLPGTYPFTGTPTDDGGYAITVDCSGAPMYANHYSPFGAQNVGGFKIYLTGAVGVAKSSAAPAVTDGNACYALEGAVYRVFADEACTRPLLDLATDAAGRAQSSPSLRPGRYWVREVEPPRGFALDAGVHAVDLSREDCRTGAVPVVAASDAPLLAPVEAIALKVDADTGGSSPLGDATLAGAVFAVEHYAGAYATLDEITAAGAAPTRTWTAVTDGEGRARIDPNSLWEDGSGNAGLALGTVVVREVSPPVGYLPSDQAFVCPVSADGGAAAATYHAPAVPDRVVRGDVAIAKFGEAEGTTGESALKAPLAGVAFDIVHQASGKVAARIVTDERGWASTEALRTGGSAGALPFGAYEVREDPATTPPGYRAASPFPVTIAENARVLSFMVENETGTALRVVKQDAETGRQVAGFTTFRLLDEGGNAVTFATHYPVEAELSTFTTDATGACTLPGKLNGGKTYYVQEVGAPEGYVLDEEPVPFTLADDPAIGADFAHPLVVTLSDAPQKGRVVLAKTDAATGAPLAGARFELRAAADIVTPDGTVRMAAGDLAASLETDGSGSAATEPLYLGAYELVETEAPEGYVRDAAPRTVVLAPGDQRLAVVDVPVAVPNEPVPPPAAIEEPPAPRLAATGDAALPLAACAAATTLAALGASTAAALAGRRSRKRPMRKGRRLRIA